MIGNMMKTFIISLMLLLIFPTLYVYAQDQPSQRCEATTKKGTRCKNKAVNNTKYCQVHQANSPSVKQCKATTKNGTRCSRVAKYSGYCKQHYQISQKRK